MLTQVNKTIGHCRTKRVIELWIKKVKPSINFAKQQSWKIIVIEKDHKLIQRENGINLNIEFMIQIFINIHLYISI